MGADPGHVRLSTVPKGSAGISVEKKGHFGLRTVPKKKLAVGLAKQDTVDTDEVMDLTTEDVDGPSGPELERTRVSDGAVKGKVVSWRGKYGFVKPSNKLDHAK